MLTFPLDARTVKSSKKLVMTSSKRRRPMALMASGVTKGHAVNVSYLNFVCDNADRRKTFVICTHGKLLVRTLEVSSKTVLEVP